MGTYECERLKTVWKDTHQIRTVAASRDVKKDWGCDSFFKREGKNRKNWANRPNLSTVNSGWREYRRTRSWQSLVHGPVIRVLKFHQNRATRTLRYCRRLLLIYRGSATEPARPGKANLLSRPVQNKFADMCGMFSSLHFPAPHLSPKFKTT